MHGIAHDSRREGGHLRREVVSYDMKFALVRVGPDHCRSGRRRSRRTNARDARAAPKRKGTSRSISRILSQPLPAGAIIHLRPLLPAAWCDLPGDSGEQPSDASADAYASF
jgi:hypothetical protein